MSTVKANNYYDASGGSTAKLYGVSMREGGNAFVNRIINGDMRIDQRNAGASVTITADQQYSLDRWTSPITQASKFSVQQSATAPTGFINSLLVTSLSSYSVLSGDVFNIAQYVEGLNVADLAWGTASAQTVTLSFWVRSSLTGTFGGAIKNSANNRSYPFTYTISAANTWEQKSITVAGDTTGTWLTTVGVGIRVLFGLGVGSTYSGTAGAWAGSNFYSATGATSVVGTNGATFYITGVQLEAGTVASPFERRPHGEMLLLCQRYFETSLTVAPVDNMTTAQTGGFAVAGSGANPALSLGFKATKRNEPTMTFFAPLTTSPSGKLREGPTGTIRTASTFGVSNWGVVFGATSGAASVDYQFGYYASSEL